MMKFITNTQPLIDACKLGIVLSNVTNFHKKSNIVQISASNNMLTINVESLRICTELTLQGHGEGEPSSIFVSSSLFRQLVETLDNPTTELIFDETCLLIKSGRSKFTLAKVVDGNEFDLKRPKDVYFDDDSIVPFKKADWEFIRNNQMYAISMSPLHPVYMKAWFGASGDVIIGDFDISLFTHSEKSSLGNTCLLTDTVVNLFTSLPDDCKIIRDEQDYIIRVSGDSYTYTTQLTPLYEDDEGVGSYNSDMILGIMGHPDDYIIVELAPIAKLLSQAMLLSTDHDDVISWKVDGTELKIYNDDVDGIIPVGGSTDLHYEVMFKLDYLKKILANYSDNELSIGLITRDGDSVGIVVWNGDMTTVLAGCE